IAVWMPVTVVPTSLATVAIDTFMTELSRVIRNCPDAKVSRTSPVPLAAASGARVVMASSSISSQLHRPQSWTAAGRRVSPARDELTGRAQGIDPSGPHRHAGASDGHSPPGMPSVRLQVSSVPAGEYAPHERRLALGIGLTIVGVLSRQPPLQVGLRAP